MCAAIAAAAVAAANDCYYYFSQSRYWKVTHEIRKALFTREKATGELFVMSFSLVQLPILIARREETTRNIRLRFSNLHISREKKSRSCDSI